MSPPPLTQLRIFSRDEDFPEIVLDIPLFSEPAFHSMGHEHEVLFPGGHKLLVYSEVSLAESVPDVSLSIEEMDGRSVDLRCSSGLIVSYTTSWNVDVLFQIGTGAWD